MAETITQVTRPPEFIEAAAKPYLTELQQAVGQFKGQDLSQIMGSQFVAGQDPLQLQAQQAALAGIGGYQPYLQSAAASAGPTGYQQFMSPYQQDVIDTTLADYDIQAQKGLPALAAQAIGAGAFGGGREGVQRAEFASQSGRDRAALQAQLLQQGFGQAQQAAQNQYQQQVGLAGLLPQLQRADVSTLGQVGAAQQAQSQAELDAQRQGARTAAYEPLERLGFFGQGVTGLMGGYPAQYQFQSTPPASPLQTALGLGTGLAGIFGALK